VIHRRKDGQGLVEYSVIVALVAIAVILVVTLLANTTTQVYSNVVCQVQGAGIFGTGACATPSAGDVSGLPGTINPGGYPGAVTADGPEAYWRLDEAGVQNGNVAVDMLGNDNGTYNTNGGSITSGITPSALTWPSGNNPTDATIRGTNINLMGGADMTPDNGLTAVQGSSARTIEVWFNNSNDTVAAGGTRQNIFEVGG
jgi:Flp pilus assembly pilin Flp